MGERGRRKGGEGGTKAGTASSGWKGGGDFETAGRAGEVKRRGDEEMRGTLSVCGFSAVREPGEGATDRQTERGWG